MGAGEAFQAGGWPLVAVVLAGAVIAYLVKRVSYLERRDEERSRAAFDLVTKREERDQERLRRFEEQEQRNQQMEARR
jgi:hypothetical protein